MLSLGGGLPSSQYFPIDFIDYKFPQAPQFTEQDTKENGVVKRVGKYDIAEGKGLYGLSSQSSSAVEALPYSSHQIFMLLSTTGRGLALPSS